MQKFINIALIVLITFKMVKSTTFSRTFNKHNVNKVKRKNGHIHPTSLPISKNFLKIHFCT